MVDVDELTKALEEAETSLDFTTVKQLVGKLKAKPAKTEAPASTQQRQAAPAAAPTAPAAASGYDPAETAVNESIFDYLVENGIQPDQVTSHLKRMMSTTPSLAQTPVRERLRAVMKAHSALGPRAQPPSKPVERPISGRGRTAGGGRTNDPQSQDPLVLARQGKMRL